MSENGENSQARAARVVWTEEHRQTMGDVYRLISGLYGKDYTTQEFWDAAYSAAGKMCKKHGNTRLAVHMLTAVLEYFDEAAQAAQKGKELRE